MRDGVVGWAGFSGQYGLVPAEEDDVRAVRVRRALLCVEYNRAVRAVRHLGLLIREAAKRNCGRQEGAHTQHQAARAPMAFCRRRWTEEPMPMASRYLATVRR